VAKKILITGAAGFFGRHLCKYINGLDSSVELIGADIVENDIESYRSFYSVDLTSDGDVSRLINQTKPEYVLHLAGLFSADSDFQIYRSNVLSTAAVLEATRKHKPDAVVIIIGSAAEYGLIEPGRLPIDETTPCNPVTAYGLSKQLATDIAMYYHRMHGLCTMVARPFQLIGKGVTTRLAPGAFAEQLKRCISESCKVIKVGNLESSRDFLDVRDAAEAVWLLSQKPAPGQVFNLCSGKPVKIKDLLNLMVEISGAQVNVESDAGRLRGKFDVPHIYGSYQKAFQHCGWRPHTSLSDSIRDIFQ
jgi:GDP-4-dehydro-6-deoxy-D-mannose reductase